MMKFKKIISVVGALSIVATMFASFSVVEASLGGKPTATAEFLNYTTNTNKTWAKAWIKVTVDLSAAEELSAYNNGLVYDEDEEDYVQVADPSGNGITTAGIYIDVDNVAFLTQDMTLANNAPAAGAVQPDGFAYKKYSDTSYFFSFGPEQTVTDYYVADEKMVYNVCFRVNDENFDSSANIVIHDLTLDGKSTTDGAVWKYNQLLGTAVATGCEIPSYNEWSNPTPSKTEITADTTAQAGHTDAADNTAFAYYVKLGADASQKTGYWTAKFDGTAYKHNQTFKVPTISGEGTANYGLIYKGDKIISDVKFVLE